MLVGLCSPISRSTEESPRQINVEILKVIPLEPCKCIRISRAGFRLYILPEYQSFIQVIVFVPVGSIQCTPLRHLYGFMSRLQAKNDKSIGIFALGCNLRAMNHVSGKTAGGWNTEYMFLIFIAYVKLDFCSQIFRIIRIKTHEGEYLIPVRMVVTAGFLIVPISDSRLSPKRESD